MAWFEWRSSGVADLPQDLVQFVEEEYMGLVKTRRLAAMQKQQRAKAGMKPPPGNIPREKPGKGAKVSATWKRG